MPALGAALTTDVACQSLDPSSLQMLFEACLMHVYYVACMAAEQYAGITQIQAYKQQVLPASASW